MKIVTKCQVHWGWLVYLVWLIILGLTFFSAYYSARMLLTIGFHLLLPAFLIPVLAINIVFYPVTSSVYHRLMKKADILVYDSGIRIKNKYLSWKQIKSISFRTGRTQRDYSFFSGIKLPALQRIYLLDTKGKEYSAIIDIDYSLKANRRKNNLAVLQEALSGLNKTNIISDWAQD
jgi:hypothetical protein